MSMTSKQGKPKPRGKLSYPHEGRSAKDTRDPPGRSGERQILSTEAEETLNAIRSGQVDALVIQGGQSDKLYAVRSFVEIERTQAALKNVAAARRRSEAQVKALAEERERLFQDMHDGCIQSIYAVGLNLEACMRLIAVDPKKTSQMLADATASLNLVIQELRSFITGHRLQIATGQDLRTEIEKAARAVANRGLRFSVDVEENAMQSLTSEQALHVLQIAREAISNAARHANARRGRIALREQAGAICLEVSDDGSGFVTKKVNKLGLGLHHIEARARKLGGTARVTSSPHQGTRVVVQLSPQRVRPKRDEAED
jgi:signal transduction histidine kinase